MSKQSNPTSAELLKRSDELRVQAEQAMRKEMPEVIAKIKQAIAHYGLTAQDLGLAKASAAVAKTRVKPVAKKGAGKRQAKSRRPSAVKFRDQNGNSWSGFGPRPKWLKEALASGVPESSLLP